MNFVIKGGSSLWYLKKVPVMLRNRRVGIIADQAEYFFYKFGSSGRLKARSLREGELTVVITSAGRKDYLEQTVESLRANLNFDKHRVRWYIIDDDPSSIETRRYIEQLGFDLVIFNSRNRGLGYSLNRIYSEVETEYVFHCEDDWLFLRQVPIDAMAQVLKADTRLRQLLLFRERVKERDYLGAVDTSLGYAKYERRFSFNPHLIMTRVFIANYPFPMIYTERGYTYKLEQSGYKLSGVWGFGEKAFVRHLGEVRTAVKY